MKRDRLCFLPSYDGFRFTDNLFPQKTGQPRKGLSGYGCVCSTE